MSYQYFRNVHGLCGGADVAFTHLLIDRVLAVLIERHFWEIQSSHIKFRHINSLALWA